MTKSKKSIVMHGTLLCSAGSRPLRLPACQRLRLPDLARCGDPRAVRDLVHFETLNSNYFLSMDPFPLAAASPLPTVLAACA